jgi:hypothetical protein
VVAGDDVLDFLGDRGGTDEVQTSEVKGMAWSALQISCRIGKGRLPEWLQATATFGSHRSGRFAEQKVTKRHGEVRTCIAKILVQKGSG